MDLKKFEESLDFDHVGKKHQERTLMMSARSAYLLRDFKKTGEKEVLQLPPNATLEFPDSVEEEKETDTQKYKRFIVHIKVDEGLYKDGIFRIEFNVKDVPHYPFQPPHVKMLTKIWHPNVHPDGTICSRILKIDKDHVENGYNPLLGMQPVVHAMLQIFEGVMNENDPGNFQEALQQYQNDRQEFNKKAKEWTKLYAQGVPIENHKLPGLLDSTDLLLD